MNFSMQLTVFRLLFSPLIFPLILYSFSSTTSVWNNLPLTVLFLAIGFTDFLDGYYARAYKQVSFLGAFLDPLADKFLVFSALITLVAVHKVCFYVAIILVGRELYIMGLRELALSYSYNLPVIGSAKVKTFLQIVYIACAILSTSTFYFFVLKLVLAVATILVSYYSVFLYSHQFYQYYSQLKNR